MGTYGSVQFFVSLLRRFTLNDHITKLSFDLANGIIQQNFRILFRNIPLNETINICIDLPFKEDNIVFGLNKKQMFEMLMIALKESMFLFDNKYHSQINGVAIGPLSVQPYQMSFCVTTKLFGLKDTQKIQTEI